MLLQEGRWTLEPYDTAAVSDAQRIWRGSLPLARQRQQIRELNGADSTP
jgi:hypothetical protein